MTAQTVNREEPLLTVTILGVYLGDKKVRGVVDSMRTVAVFVVGVLAVGIVLGLFNIIAGMSVNINGTAYSLIPSNIASLAGSTVTSLISVIIAMAIIFILLPVIFYLMTLFGRGR
jgi:hypothetical protein